MGEDGVIRIADFGISKMLADGERLSNAAGTPAFMSPELCSGAPSVSGQQADVWAIAAAMFMLRFGHPPFLAGSIVHLYNKIINDPLVFPHVIDPALQNLLEHMLEKDPEKRYTIDEVIRHPWLTTPPTTVVKSVSRRDNFGVWPPAPTYDKDERAAMDSPLKTANRDEMYSSIVGNTSTLVDKDSKQIVSDHKGSSEEEIMTTNWGLDVFEHVDDGDFQSGSEDEVDSVDEEPPGGKIDAKDSAPSRISSTHDVMATNGSKSDDAMSTLGSKTSVSSRHDMDLEEEQKRAQRFQKLGKSKVVQQAPPSRQASDWSDSDSEEFSKKAGKVDQKKSFAPSIFDTNIDAKDIGIGAPSAPKVGTSAISKDRPPTLKVARGDSMDIDADEGIAENLTMDDFSSMMDTLSGPVHRSVPNTPNTPSPMVLGSFEITEMQKNPFNGVGIGFHSEQGVRPNQEDRCLVHPTLLLADAVAKSSQFEGDDAEFFKKVSIAAIFDGHSGAGCADYLHEHFVSKLISSKDAFKTNLPALIKETFCIVDDEVCRYLRAEDDVSGSTGLVMVYNGR
jgi:serine/threonine protein kinase